MDNKNKLMNLFNKRRILYLAKYAPYNNERKPTLDGDIGVLPIYHWEIYTLLNQIGLEVIPTRDHNDLFKIDKYDYVFSLYNTAKFNHSEIYVSAVCEYLKKPFLGAPPNIRAIAEDKNLAKILACRCGIPTPEWTVYHLNQKRILKPNFKGPYFIKPRFESGSRGISQDSYKSTWKSASNIVNKLLNEGREVIVEKFIPGKNVTFPIVADFSRNLMPCIEGMSELKGNIQSNLQKRLIQDGLHREVFNDEKCSKKIKLFSNKIYDNLFPIDYARFDFRVQESTNNPFFLEFNICCNLGSHSTIVNSAKEVGINQKELLIKILLYSINRQQFLWQ